DRHPHSFPTRRSSDLEGGDEHEQGGFRQVEVGEHGADYAEVEAFALRAGMNKDVGIAGAGENLAVVLTRDELERADSRGSDGDRSEEHTSELQSLAYL